MSKRGLEKYIRSFFQTQGWRALAFYRRHAKAQNKQLRFERNDYKNRWEMLRKWTPESKEGEHKIKALEIDIERLRRLL